MGLAKFYEFVDHDAVRKEAAHQAFPSAILEGALCIYSGWKPITVDSAASQLFRVPGTIVAGAHAPPLWQKLSSVGSCCMCRRDTRSYISVTS